MPGVSSAPRAPAPPVTRRVADASPRVNEVVTPAGCDCPILPRMEHSASAAGAHATGVLRCGVLEMRPQEGLAIAAGVALRLSVRELGLLTRLAGSEGHVVRREDLYADVWGAPLRTGDRTIDVYVRKLRVKLERALPEWSFIHTHVGFGYRFAPERSQGFHTQATVR